MFYQFVALALYIKVPDSKNQKSFYDLWKTPYE